MKLDMKQTIPQIQIMWSGRQEEQVDGEMEINGFCIFLELHLNMAQKRKFYNKVTTIIA